MRRPWRPRDARKQRRISLKRRLLRRFGTSRLTFIVTWTGVGAWNSGRAEWLTSALSPFGLRPAPRRLPPWVRKANANCFDELMIRDCIARV